MIVVFSAPLDVDLSGFTKQLWKMKIVHRVVIEQSQVLIVEDEHNAQLVTQLYQHWQQEGELTPELVREVAQIGSNSATENSRAVDFKKIPLVLLLLVSSLLLTLGIDFGQNIELRKLLSITDFDYVGGYNSLNQSLESMQLWRFISPIFMHFSIIHLIFNGLWIWVIGTVIEQQQKSLVLLGIVIFSAISSNIVQYLVSGPYFGGLSGVVYALISYAWLWDKMTEKKLLVVSNALMGFMVVFLVLGYSGLLTRLGLGDIANTAHLSGLVAGLIAAVVLAVVNVTSLKATDK
ncbi:MAG: hypothetical protein OFPI_05820 [Osedax symbiont Rs2]|nr:MAG: hypothetical protein OFPI_05820 [Osedax symbiont Rs2]